MHIPRPIRHLLAAGATVLAMVASAAAAEVDFAGKTITIVVGFGAGGSYDLCARLAADHLGRFLPGNPTVVVENMPGGGGARAVAFLAAAAPKDGTVVSLIPSTIIFDSAMGNLPAGVEAGDFGYVGRLTSPLGVAVTWHTSPTKTVADAKLRDTTMAATGATSMSSFIPRLLDALIGTKFKVVEGYKGSADMALAMERGEVGGLSWNLDSIASAHPNWLGADGVNILWLIALERNRHYPDIPALTEFAENEQQRALIAVVASEGGIGRSLALPPGVPDEVVAAYQSAFDQMIKDPGFIADAGRRMLPLDPASGSTVRDIVRTTLKTPPGTIEALDRILKSEEE
jgi:tripartite-type tricarboxylate transporter receptor subunit TctC